MNPRYDYHLQAWYDADTGVVQPCNHPPGQRQRLIDGRLACCDANRWAGVHKDVAMRHRSTHA